MRYQSPPVLPSNNQDSPRERAERHRRNQQEELRRTSADNDRCAEHRVNVLSERAKCGEARSTEADIHRAVTNWLFPRSAVNQRTKTSPENDIVSKGVFVWVETIGTGHTLLTVHDPEITMFSYGRYGDIYENTLGTEGEGVLIKATGDDSLKYLRSQLYKNNAKVFKIIDANASKVFEELDKHWSSSEKTVDSQARELVAKHGRVIDSYSLLGNNCTTKIVDALKVSGSKVFDSSLFGVEFEEDFIIPSSLSEHLEESASTFDMISIEVTSDMKLKIKNVNSIDKKELSDRDRSYQSVTSSSGALGESSGLSINK
ncbi:hypothetical protein [Vibrio coralliilyticus]|uniref:hypothetical protein n=1 Tax=Vibrio coralliilyticus TaxID=190893 RepID=UPI00117DBB85|nr:hypothetical protein [Vibrio coralliilyticus]NOI58890.1 hypothetical protein [Vibrio coralliilyticus]